MISNRINVLTPDIYNKISAGEVVEKPASALKEVVENSIDAGARRILIEVTDGGFQLISVSDNGSGIYEEDLEAAFIKHATSKLSSAEDLTSIQTLGFRGEALSSIAAVSRIKLTSRKATSETGVTVTVENGKITSKQYVSANVGTKIEIRDLFYNTPARKKFMKAPAREAVDISKFVAKLILTNPNLQITYILDGKTVYQTKGEGLSEAIFAVYGADCLENCLPVRYDGEAISINGYIGSPQYSKPNSTYQTLSVNGRCVIDKNIQNAIAQAFKPYLMGRQYPFFVLDVALPCDTVDVNVHPRKTEVRFQNLQMVCGKFYRAVEKTLKEFTEARVKQTLGVDSAPTQQSEQEEIYFTPNRQFVPSTFFKNISEMTADQVSDVLEIQKQTNLQRVQPLEEFADELERTLTVQSARKEMGLDEEEVRQPAATMTMQAQPLPVEMPAKGQPEPQDIADELLEKTRVLGSAFRTYLILEIDDKVIFVDQHAAHERILFDKFMEGKSQAMQQLLFPFVFSVKDDEADFIERNLENILKAGVEVEPFGKNTFRICSVSTLLSDTKMDEFVRYLLADADKLNLDDKQLIVEKVASMACKAAVKAGYVLTEFEIKYILKGIYENKILQCPHGRPITVVFTKTQLEKMFKRIV